MLASTRANESPHKLILLSKVRPLFFHEQGSRAGTMGSGMGTHRAAVPTLGPTDTQIWV